MSNFFEALKTRTPIEKTEHEFRLYYDRETGSPLFYSMEDKEGDYIVVDKETYAESPTSIRIVDGKIKKYVVRDISKLVQGGNDTTCHNDDITIVVNESGTNWSLRQYED